MLSIAVMPPHADDDQMIRRTLSGDSEAFSGLILKYKDSLFDMAYRILANRAEAEDTLQDAFLQAYKHLADFNHQSRFSTWIYSIVLNRVRNQLRHRKVIRWTSLDFIHPDHEEESPREIAERQPSFQSVLEHRLELASIQREVRFLPEVYQALFILHYFQNLSIQEVAARVNRSAATVKVYLHRARKMLYKRLKSRKRLHETGSIATIAAA